MISTSRKHKPRPHPPGLFHARRNRLQMARQRPRVRMRQGYPHRIPKPASGARSGPRSRRRRQGQSSPVRLAGPLRLRRPLAAPRTPQRPGALPSIPPGLPARRGRAIPCPMARKTKPASPADSRKRSAILSGSNTTHPTPARRPSHSAHRGDHQAGCANWGLGRPACPARVVAGLRGRLHPGPCHTPRRGPKGLRLAKGDSEAASQGVRIRGQG